MREYYAFREGTRRVRPRLFLPVLLFIVTVFTTMTAGAFYEGVNPLHDPAGLIKGIPFSASLLFILGTHELGHFFASKKHRIHATLPYFIPGPPIPPMIGTFGAIIKMKAPITTKGALVDIGAAGPLTGFVAAVLITSWGLSISTLIPTPPPGSVELGSPLVFKALSALMVGPMPEGKELMLHPVAFAGWIGMFVTSLNLLPIGQLDGGHIVYALLGPYHRTVSILMVFGLLSMGILTWLGWFVWAVLVSIIGIWHPPVADQHIGLAVKRKIIGISTIIVFILTFTPTPFYIS